MSFRFHVRSPCRVSVEATGPDEVTVTVALNKSERGRAYVPPDLPPRREVTYNTDDLDKLSPGSKTWLVLAEEISALLGGLVGGPILLGYVR